MWVSLSLGALNHSVLWIPFFSLYLFALFRDFYVSVLLLLPFIYPLLFLCANFVFHSSLMKGV